MPASVTTSPAAWGSWIWPVNVQLLFPLLRARKLTIVGGLTTRLVEEVTVLPASSVTAAWICPGPLAGPLKVNAPSALVVAEPETAPESATVSPPVGEGPETWPETVAVPRGPGTTDRLSERPGSATRISTVLDRTGSP